MPGFRKMNPAPKIALTRFGAGVHSFWKAEKDLPVGIAPSVLRTWHDAVVGGYFLKRSSARNFNRLLLRSVRYNAPLSNTSISLPPRQCQP